MKDNLTVNCKENNLIVGCSHVEGFELEEEIGIDIYNHTNNEYNQAERYRKDKKFSSILFKHLGEDYCASYMTGCDNSWITYETIRLVNSSPNLKNVIISWTGITRQQKSFNSKTYFLNPLYPGHSKDIPIQNPNSKLLSNWEEAENKLFLDINFYQKQTYHYAHYLKLFLESKKINFFFIESINTGVNFSKFTSNTLDISMKDFCEKHNYKQGKGGHFLSEAHKAWGYHLYKNFKNKFI